MLRDSVDRFGQNEWPASGRLKILADGQAAARRRWRQMADLGWLMLPIAEASGGLGGSPVDVMAVMEGFGRHLIVAPYVSTCVLVPALVGASETAAEMLAAIGAGEALAAAALSESGGDLTYIETRAERVGNGWQLTGVKPHVADGADADWFVVSARTSGDVGDAEGIGLFLMPRETPGATVHGFRAIDGHRHARLTLEAAAAVPIGDPDGASAIIERAQDRAICAELAEATGSMEAATAFTLDYLKTRKQFGVAIGTFQALQHRMVDMTVACEEARAMTYHATLTLDGDDDDRRRAVSAGKVRVGQSGIYVGQQAVQLHGGVGFSEELIVSHHLRRQMMLDLEHGGADHHKKTLRRKQERHPMSMIRLDVSDYVAVVTMDNPPVNAQPIEFIEELTEIFDTFNDRDDVRAVVLTGAGKMFSAGADLKQRPDFSIKGFRSKRNRVVREVSYAITDNAKPTIAAVNGPALGAGLGLVASCDIIVASERAVFGLPEVDVGLMGGGKHAARIFPHSLVRRMMLTGYRVPAEEAYRRGVIEACLPAEELMPWAMDLAKTIASKSPLATKFAKDSMRTIENMTLRDGYVYEQGNTAKLSTSRDAAEAVRAFVEKRAPVFEGC